MLAEVVGNPHGVLNGVGIRAPVAHDGDAFEAQQWRAAVLGIVQAPFEFAKGLFCEDIADFSCNRFLQFLTEHCGECLDQAFAQLQRDVAGETVADDDVDVPLENIAPFDITDKVDRRALQRFERFLGQLVSF